MFSFLQSGELIRIGTDCEDDFKVSLKPSLIKLFSTLYKACVFMVVERMYTENCKIFYSVTASNFLINLFFYYLAQDSKGSCMASW